MIWSLDNSHGLITAFRDAGPIDKTVVNNRTNKAPMQQQPSRPEVKRWYYLHKDEPCISLCCLGMPLEEWKGAAMLIVGTREIIGEFKGNRHIVGRKGFHMKMQPLTWLQGDAEKHFTTGDQLLAEISEQVLDRREIDRAQHSIEQKYRWEK